MPYIKKEDRTSLSKDLPQPLNCGELNYVFTMICMEYLEKHGERYQTYNDIVGAMECCKIELYRRKIVPYEQSKIKENGDVF